MTRPTIRVSDHVMDQLRKATTPGYEFRQTGVRLADGTWEFPTSDEQLEQLDRLKLAGESYNDVIERLFATVKSSAH